MFSVIVCLDCNKVELSWVESHIDILWYIHSATQPVTQFSIWYPYVRVACNANKTDIVSDVRISTYYSENRLTWPRVVKSVSKLSFIVLLLFCMYDLSQLPSTINWKRFFYTDNVTTACTARPDCTRPRSMTSYWEWLRDDNIVVSHVC